MRVDVTAPTVALGPLPSGFTGGFTESDPLVVTLGDNRPSDGIGRLRVTVNAATDGSGSGAELPLLDVDRPGAGQRRFAAALPAGIGEGTHRITATVSDPSYPEALSTSDRGVIRVDTTSPSLGDASRWSVAPDTAAGAGRFVVTLPAVDDATSGVAAVRVGANANATGALTGAWSVVGTTVPTAATVRVPIDMSAFSEGRHALRIEAVDAAGNVAQASGPSVVIDRTPPTIVGLTVDTARRVARFSQRDAVGFGACPTSVELRGVGTSGAWRPVEEITGNAVPADGAAIALPLGGMAGGEYFARVTACDAASNRASATARFIWAPDAPVATESGRAASSPEARSLAGARLISFGREGGAGAVRVFARVALRGRVVGAGGRAVANARVAILDPVGRLQARARTNRAGGFRATVRAVRGGRWFAVAEANSGVRASIALSVRAGLAVVAPTRSLRVGDTLRVSGTITPSASAAGKLLQLQWRDGRVWRPVANANAAPSGAFVILYRFKRARGYRVALRVLVPADRGWPFLAVASPPFTVRVS
ncbi:MAG: hypothetical protein HYX33_02240 [Actinobacteria bacterium]|nr:hypothetical protein [Actinomycetota bacterium]